MSITNKNYKCSVCGNIELHSTNHFGDIYCACKKCGNGQLSCIEGNQPEINVLPTKLSYYRFNIENETEKRQYQELKKELICKRIKNI